MGSVGSNKNSAISTVVDYDKLESTFKEGRFSKTNAVPVFRQMSKNQYELSTADGYGTRVNGDVFYIQKVGSREWRVNWNGMLGGRGSSTLSGAKEELKNVAAIVKRMTKSQRDTQKKLMDFLKQNNGKMTAKQFRELTNS